MNYGFDTVINRFGTSCVKYDLLSEYGYPPGTIPMWVADMDFPAPPEVRKRLVELAETGMYVYTFVDEEY
ncbi:MAG: aminotransferase, partial [Clostridiales bacterium]|nr:aminotransferase [Clostridiales bacterium]